jgi:hypothetical protein
MVHIHDGKVHAQATFDHTFYCQGGPEEEFALNGWTESPTLAKSFVKLDKAKEIVDGERHCYRKELRGNLLNTKTLFSPEPETRREASRCAVHFGGANASMNFTIARTS